MSSTEKLNLLKADIPIGASTTIHLISGADITAVLEEIGSGFIVLTNADGKKQRIFEPMIGGWEVAAASSHNEKKSDGVDPELERTVLAPINNINASYAKDLSVTIVTNATVSSVSSTAIKVLTDDGRTIKCLKRYIAGYSKKVCVPGARVFCKPHRTKEYCLLCVMEMTYSDMMKLLEKAISMPVKNQIINSIVSYYKVNHSYNQTKPILKKIPLFLEPVESIGDSTPNLHETLNRISREVAAGNVSQALDSLDVLLASTKDNKQKATILLRKAQIFSSLKQYEDAISAYSALIEFNEGIKAPLNSIGHLYAELTRLYTIINDMEKAEEANAKALEYKSPKADSQGTDDNEKSNSPSDSKEGAPYSSVTLKPMHMSPVYKRLVDDDIERHVFTDPEVKSLKGAINLDIANKLIEKSKGSEKPETFLEVAKALKSLPAGSYAYQDYEDAVINYSIAKSESLYSSFCSIIQSADSIEKLEVDQLTKIKDCAICYYREAIEYATEGNGELTWSLVFDVIKLELADNAIKKNAGKGEIIAILDNSDINHLALAENHDSFISVILTIMSLAARCQNLWDKQLKDSEFIKKINRGLDDKTKKELLSAEVSAKAVKKVPADNENFLFELIQWEHNFIHTFNGRFKKFTGTPLNLFAMDSLKKCFTGLDKAKFKRCISASDKKTISDIRYALGILTLFKSSDAASRKTIIRNSIKELNDIILWNTDPTTDLGRFMFAPTLQKWVASLSHIESSSEDISCALTLSLDPPYYLLDKETSDKSFKMILHNPKDLIVDGFRLDLWLDDDTEHRITMKESSVILPKSNISLNFSVPDSWGDDPVYELNYILCSLHKDKESKEFHGSATLSKKRTIKKNLVLKWKDEGDVEDEIFKGRDEIVSMLKEHYSSGMRYNTYVLYGLSRTGKSCILHHLERAIRGTVITSSKGTSKKICPVYLDLSEVVGYDDKGKEHFWSRFLKKATRSTCDHCKIIAPESIPAISKPYDFDDFIEKMNDVGLHPLFMFDEFSAMKEIIDKGYINSSFLQYMRKLSTDDDLVSFIFAGTYDIYDLIFDSNYNISGAFTYLTKPDKPIFEISEESAEELISIMGNAITFTPAAIREIHRLSGNVPYWIQKICLGCGLYAKRNDKPDIGLSELELVTKRMVGEHYDSEDDLSIITKLENVSFIKTQYLSEDPKEYELIMTSIAFLMRHGENPIGVQFEQMQELWQDHNINYTDYDISKSIEALIQRDTLSKELRDEQTYYRFSLDLFRRWWDMNHFDINLQLSSFNAKS